MTLPQRGWTREARVDPSAGFRTLDERPRDERPTSPRRGSPARITETHFTTTDSDHHVYEDGRPIHHDEQRGARGYVEALKERIKGADWPNGYTYHYDAHDSMSLNRPDGRVSVYCTPGFDQHNDSLVLEIHTMEDAETVDEMLIDEPLILEVLNFIPTGEIETDWPEFRHVVRKLLRIL